MSELSLAIAGVNGVEPRRITLSNGTPRTYKRSFDVMLGCMVVEVQTRDIDADPAKLGWVRSVSTCAGDFYDVTDQAWVHHLDQDGNPRIH